MTRLISIAGFAASMVLGTTIVFAQAGADSQAEIAKRLNEEGKAFMYADNYPQASEKFRQAVARVPEAKYFYNLCASLYKEGKFGEALTACNASSNSDTAAPELKTQSAKLAQGVRDEAKRQGVDVEPTGGGGPDMNCTANPSDPRCQTAPPPDICQTNPEDPACQQTITPPPPQTFAVGKPPTQDILAGTTSDNKYTWTLGVELFGGGGKVGQKDFYGSAASGLRIKGDYLLNSTSRVGAQGYFTFTHFGKGDKDITDATLDIIDFGVAVYKHLCPSTMQRLCLTPLAGAQLAMMSPNGADDGVGSRVFQYAAVGARIELGAHIGFGTRNEHVLGVALGANIYSSVFSGPSADDIDNPSVMDVGLDKGGAAGYLSVGYTYRFNTPLGSSPFVTLQ